MNVESNSNIMKKLFLILSFPLAFIFSLSAQITQTEADLIVMERLSDETKDFIIYAQDSVPTEGYTITTSLEEMLELDYSCWVYYVNYPDEPNGKYLIVKESNGSLLEVNTNNDEGPEDLEEWRDLLDIIEHSVWECIEIWSWEGGYFYDIYFELSFYPSIGKVIIKSEIEPNMLIDNGIFDYYVIEYDNGTKDLCWILPPHDPYPQRVQCWTLEKSENVLILKTKFSTFSPPYFKFQLTTNFNGI